MNSPELRYSSKHRAWFFLMEDNRYSGAARKAGFAFHKKVRQWFTYDIQKAARLSLFAAEKTAERLDRIQSVLRLSYATGHESFCESLEIKNPPSGKEFKPYQRVGVRFIADRAVALVADEQGLGKTVQAIGAWNEITPKHTLVICPASVKYNWHKEFSAWATREFKCHIQQGKKGFPLNRPDLVIVNYDVLDALHEELTDKPWDMVIIDEAQNIKNAKAKRTQAVLGYRKKPGIIKGAKNVVLLTGTPIPNRPIEFWPVLTRLSPETIFPFTKYFDFGRRFCDGYQGPFGWDMTGSSHENELNVRLRSTLMIRRLKKDVLTDLPDKIYQVIPVEVDKDAQKLVKRESDIVGLDRLRKTGLPPDSQIGELSELRHKLALAKVAVAVSHIVEMLDGGVDKVVVFAYHSAVIKALMEGLKDYNPVKIDGDTPPGMARQRAVDTFQTKPECRVFVGQIIAAGVGITLTAASNVVFVESTWVSGDIAQAVDRCHRIGQKNSVLAQFLVIRDSLEEYMLRTVVDKQHTINRIVN